MSNELSTSPTVRGVCGADDTEEDMGGLGYDAVAGKSKNAVGSDNGGGVKSMLFARLGGAVMGTVMGGGGCDVLGPNVRK
jgi:hypothetical protein